MQIAKVLAVALSVFAVTTPTAKAETLVFEGFHTVNRFRVAGVGLEYRFAPFREKNGTALSWMLRGMYDEGDNSWLGAGLHIRHDYASGWFIEGATGPGYYSHSAKTYDLGLDLQFFSYFGVGRKVGEDSFVSLIFGHMSNANIGSTNPGRNSVSVRFGTQF
jgi:hypothetical protein